MADTVNESGIAAETGAASGERRAELRTQVLETAAGIVAVELDQGDSGIILDLTPDGMMVQCMAPLVAGDTRTTSFILPGCSSPLNLSAVVVWSDPEGRAGLRFRFGNDGSRKELKNWVAESRRSSLTSTSSLFGPLGLDRAPEPPAATRNEPAPSSSAVSNGAGSTGNGLSHSNAQRPTVSDPVPPLALSAAIPGLPVLTGIDDASDEHQLAVNAVVWTVVEEISRLTPAHGAVVALAQGQMITCRASWGSAPGIGARLQPEVGLSGECFRTGLPILCNDAENDPRVPASVSTRLNLKSILVVPVLGPHTTLGLLEALAADKNAFTDSHVRALTRLASSLSEVLLAEVGPAEVPAKEVPASEVRPKEVSAKEVPGKESQPKEAEFKAAKQEPAFAGPTVPQQVAVPPPTPSVPPPAAASTLKPPVAAVQPAPPSAPASPVFSSESSENKKHSEAKSAPTVAEPKLPQRPASQAKPPVISPTPLPRPSAPPASSSGARAAAAASKPTAPPKKPAPAKVEISAAAQEEVLPLAGSVQESASASLKASASGQISTPKAWPVAPASSSYKSASPDILSTAHDSSDGESRTMIFAGIAAVVLLAIIAAFWTLSHRGAAPASASQAQLPAETASSATAEDNASPESVSQATSSRDAAEIPVSNQPAPAQAKASTPAPAASRPAPRQPQSSEPRRSESRAVSPPEDDEQDVTLYASSEDIRKPAAVARLRPSNTASPVQPPPSVSLNSGSGLALPSNQVSAPRLAAPPPPTAPQLIHRVEPSVPQNARTLSGTVVLAATIGTDGRPADIKAVSGQPLLVAAAISAFRNWRYEPARRAGNPIEVPLQVRFVFNAQ